MRGTIPPMLFSHWRDHSQMRLPYPWAYGASMIGKLFISKLLDYNKLYNNFTYIYQILQLTLCFPKYNYLKF